MGNTNCGRASTSPHALARTRRTRAASLARTLMILGTLAATTSSASARNAQPESNPPSTPASTPAPAPPPLTPPGPAESMQAFDAVLRWVRAWEVPQESQPLLSTEVAAGRFSGAMLTLRHQRRVVARVVATEASAQTIWRLTRDALAQAGRTLVPNPDATTPDVLLSLAADVRVSLQLAGPMIPYAPVTYGDVDLEIEPGLEGVAARAGDSLRTVFPEQQWTDYLPPGDALAMCVADVTGEPALRLRIDPENQPAAVREKRGVAMYRFDVTHLAQLQPGGPGVFLHRGGRVIEANQLTSEALRSLRLLIAARLTGTDVNVATPSSRILVDPIEGREGAELSVGARWMRLAGVARSVPDAATGLPRDEAGRALVRRAAHDLTLADALFKEQSSPDADPGAITPVVAALYAIASNWSRPMVGEGTTPGPDANRAMRSRLASAFTNGAWNADVPESQRGVIAYALCLIANDQPPVQGDEPGPSITLQDAEAALRAIYLDTKPGLIVTHMPWLIWAERALADRKGVREIPAAVALREAREQAWLFQVSADDAGQSGRDLAGGFIFTAARNPLPSVLSARPLAGLAAMAADPALTTAEELPGEIVKLLAGARFLRQLCADEATAYAYADPKAAMFGVRTALWDQRMTVEGQVMTLLALSEIDRALARFAKEMNTPPAPAKPAAP